MGKESRIWDRWLQRLASWIRLRHVPFLGSQRWPLDGDLKSRGSVRLEKVTVSKISSIKTLRECEHPRMVLCEVACRADDFVAK